MVPQNSMGIGGMVYVVLYVVLVHSCRYAVRGPLKPPKKK